MRSSKDYTDIRDKFRPGHADYTYWAKYGVRDYRGGGRQSARETASRVAAGAIARKVLNQLYKKVVIRGALIQMGTRDDRARALELGGGCEKSVLLPRRQSRCSVDGVSRSRAQEAARPAAR